MLGGRVGVLRPDRVLLVDGDVVREERALREGEAGDGLRREVDEAGTPQRTAASSVLKVAMRLLRKTVWAGFCVGSGIAAAWTTASWPRTSANASPGSVRSAWT